MAATSQIRRTAQSKASVKAKSKTTEDIVLRVEGSSKVVKILNDGAKEYQVEDTNESIENDLVSAVENKMNGSLCEEKNSRNSPVKGKRHKKISNKVEVSASKLPKLGKEESDNSNNQNSASSTLPNMPTTPTKKKLKNIKEEKVLDNLSVEKVSSVHTDKDSIENSVLTEHIPRCVIIRPQEIPNEATLASWNTVCVSYDQQKPPIYVGGEMLWAKVSGHPFWPCMVAKCPFTHVSTRIKGMFVYKFCVLMFLSNL